MSMVRIYEIPNSIQEIFENGETSYRIIDYTIESMDNNKSMEYFLEYSNILPDYIEDNYGTQVILKHPDYQYNIVIDSGGLGDFYSHIYVASVIFT